MVITLVGKVLGLLRDRLLSINYGVGIETNAFLTASLIPRVFFDAIFASAIASSFIPVFNEYFETEGKERAYRFTNQFVTLVIVFTAMLTVLGIVFSKELVILFADGLDPEAIALCQNLLYILFPTLVFTGIAFSFVGVLQSMNQFAIPAALSIASNGVIIIYYIFFSSRFGIYGLAVAFLIGWGMQVAIQIPSLIKRSYWYKPNFHFKNEEMKKVLVLMLPVMVSTWVQPINIAINTKFASRIYEGAGISAIQFANNLYTIIIGVFVLSVANVIFPMLSKLTTYHRKEEFAAVLNSTLRVMIYLVVPMMVGLMCISHNLISLVYGGKEFGEFAIDITARALFFFSFGMLGYAFQTVLCRAYFAAQKGVIPLIAGGISILVNLLLCEGLFGIMDVGGLALASAISSIANAVVLMFPFISKQKGIINKAMVIEVVRVLICSAVMVAVVLPVQHYVGLAIGGRMIGKLVTIAVSTGSGLIVYMICSFLIGVKEARIVSQYVKSQLKKRI